MVTVSVVVVRAGFRRMVTVMVSSGSGALSSVMRRVLMRVLSSDALNTSAANSEFPRPRVGIS